MAIKHSFSAATFPCIAHCEYCAVARAVRCSGSCAARTVDSAVRGTRGAAGGGGEAVHIRGGVGSEEEADGRRRGVLRQPSESAQPRLQKMHFLNQMAVVFSAPKDPQELLAELQKFRVEFRREACSGRARLCHASQSRSLQF
jgi:hypothetical protein